MVYRVGIFVILYFRPLGGVWEPLGRKNRGKKKAGIDKRAETPQTKTMLQLSGNCDLPGPLGTLVDLRRGEAGIVDRLDLPADDARRLMELGFLPGTRVTAGQSAPGGDPRVFQVDGSEIALRSETAKLMKIRPDRGNDRSHDRSNGRRN
jgi:ferrous iron transport protein A